MCHHIAVSKPLPQIPIDVNVVSRSRDGLPYCATKGTTYRTVSTVTAFARPFMADTLVTSIAYTCRKKWVAYTQYLDMCPFLMLLSDMVQTAARISRNMLKVLTPVYTTPELTR